MYPVPYLPFTFSRPLSCLGFLCPVSLLSFFILCQARSLSGTIWHTAWLIWGWLPESATLGPSQAAAPVRSSGDAFGFYLSYFSVRCQQVKHMNHVFTYMWKAVFQISFQLCSSSQSLIKYQSKKWSAQRLWSQPLWDTFKSLSIVLLSWVVMGTEPRTSQILGMYSTTELCSLPRARDLQNIARSENSLLKSTEWGSLNTALLMILLH